jgi:hypothetical protein
MLGLVAIKKGANILPEHSEWRARLAPYSPAVLGNITDLTLVEAGSKTRFRVTAALIGVGDFGGPNNPYPLGCWPGTVVDSDSRITFTGVCGNNSLVSFTTNAGFSGRFEANVLCHVYKQGRRRRKEV